MQKLNDLVTLGDYRPISLIRLLYNIIIESLANKLKYVVVFGVDEVQSTYIEGRNILDRPLIMN